MKFKLLIAALLLTVSVSAQTIGDTTTLRNFVNSNIVPNGNNRITAGQLSIILNGFLNVLKSVSSPVDSAFVAQLKTSFRYAAFDTTKRAFTLVDNAGDTTVLIIPGGSGSGGSGSGINALSQVKRGNVITIFGDNGDSVHIDITDTRIANGDTTNWNGKMDSARTISLLAGYASLTGNYVNPAFILSLPLSKITGIDTTTNTGYSNRGNVILVAGNAAQAAVNGIAIGTINSQTKSANGATYINGHLYQQTADTANTGLETTLDAKTADSIRRRMVKDTLQLQTAGSGISPAFSNNGIFTLKTFGKAFGLQVWVANDSTIIFGVDSTLIATKAELINLVDSLAAHIPSGGGGGSAQSGYSIQFTYGQNKTGIPIKGGDSSYTNANLVGDNVQILMSGPAGSEIMLDSGTWSMTGRNASSAYYTWNKAGGKAVFHNFNNVAGIVNGQEVVTIMGLPGYGLPAFVDTGGTVLGPPTVSAGSNQTILYPTSSATLTGSAVPTIAGGSIAAYQWSIVSEPTGAAATISAPTSASTPIGNMSLIGTYTYQLKATDNVGNAGYGSTQVTVSNPLAAKFNISQTAQNVSGWTNIAGQLANTDLTVTDANTGWQVVNTHTAWNGLGGGNTGNNGPTSSTDADFPAAAIAGNAFNYSQNFTGSYQLTLPNLAAGNYTIELFGGVNSGTWNTNGNSEYLVQFGTATAQEQDFNPTGNTTTHLTYTGTITAGQVISIWVGKPTSGSSIGDSGWINAFIVKKNS